VKNGENIVAAEWVDLEVKSNIKDRQVKSRAWRLARNRKESQHIQDHLEKEYKAQQNIASKCNGTKKGAGERKKIREAKTSNGKSLWKVAKEILGRTKKKSEQVYLYREDLSIHKSQDNWE